MHTVLVKYIGLVTVFLEVLFWLERITTAAAIQPRKLSTLSLKVRNCLGNCEKPCTLPATVLDYNRLQPQPYPIL